MRKNLFLRAIFLGLLLLLGGCEWMSGEPSPSPSPSLEPSPTVPSPSPSPEPYIIKVPEGETLETRVKPPEGFSRGEIEDGSFAAFLRETPLKPDGEPAYLYDGTIKPDDRFDAVMKMDINTRDLMRNANFLQRMRAEYLYGQARFGDIEFHFLSGFAFGFSKWAEGNNIKVDVSDVEWVPSETSNGSYESFLTYLNTLYVYSNTTALKQDLLQSNDMQIGCVFTAAGGAIVADLAEDGTGRRAVLLLRAGEPEQEGYVVRNTGEPDVSPWFIVPDNGIINTPEGELSVGDVYVFK